MPEHLAHVVATVVVAMAALMFTTWIFAVLGHTYRQLEAQGESLARLEERERIAVELHDSIIQSLYGVGLKLEEASERWEGSPPAVRERLDGAIDSLHQIIQDIRNYIFDLRPRVSQVDDLPGALATLVDEVKVNTLMEASLNVEGDLGALSDEQALSLYHVAQEALNNVKKHAKASSVAVRLHSDNGRLRLEVADNGVGFEPEADHDVAKQGLRNMMDRARALGADLVIESAPGKGARIRLDLSLPERKG